MVLPLEITGWQVQCADLNYGTFDTANEAGEWLFNSGHYEGVIVPVFQPVTQNNLRAVK